MHDQPTNFSRSGEGYLVDQLMRGKWGACAFAVSGQYVDDAFRETCFVNQLSQTQSSERCLLGQLDDNATSGGERRTQLPCCHQQRDIPGNDLPDYPDRFAQGVGKILPG